MENKLYQMMGELGGMEIPMNQPSGGSNNIRLRNRGGELASDLPPPMVVDEPVNTNAN
jgi:N-acetylglucosamine-6-sulfatase